MKNNAIIAHEKDNVCTVVQELNAGEKVRIKDKNGDVGITVNQHIPCYHKVALVDIAKGEAVYKYGEVIGAALVDVKTGEHVHVHNVESTRGRGDKK